MRPKGTRGESPLTPAEKKEILRLTRAGVKQIEIAKQFGCAACTIQRLKKRCHLRRWALLTPKLEERIVRSLRAGPGIARVGKLYRVSEGTLRAIMKRHNIVHPIGVHGLYYTMPAEKLAALDKKILAREDYAKNLAKSFGVNVDFVRARCHQLLGPAPLYHWPRKPLESDDPQTARRARTYREFLEAVFLKLRAGGREMQKISGIFTKFVEDYLRIWHHGVLPADQSAFLQNLLDAYMPAVPPGPGSPLTANEWEQERLSARNYLRAAIDQLAGSESSGGWIH